MKTVIRNSYTPNLGDYCDTIVVDRETSKVYFFDCDGVWTELDKIDAEEILAEAAAYTDEKVAPLAEKLDTIEEGAQVNVIEKITQNGTELTITNKTVNVTVPTKTSDLANDGSDGTDTYVESATLSDYYTKDETDTQIGYETNAREIADSGLQEQIDAIVASSDVVDIVGTYAALQAYDTTKLHDNDIIKVLADETRDGATTYYRWDADTSTWSYIGAEGPFYTKAESDAIFTPMTRTINSKALSADITLTAADVGALPDSTVIPTVNDATLTIQKNGVDVQTFTANQSTNTTANITVPTDTSDLTNGAGFITSAALPTNTSDLTNDGSDGTSVYVEADDYATAATAGVIKTTSAFGVDMSGSGEIKGTVVSSVDYPSMWNDAIVSKGTLENALSTKNYATMSDLPTVNDATLTIQKNGVDVATFTANSSTNQTANIAVPTDTSDLTNGAGFITTAALSNYYTKSETYSQNEVNSLINGIVVPTKTSDLANDGDDGVHPFLATDDVATVATTGNYSDLNGAPGDFTGTDGVNAGVHGLVPAPTTSDVNKYLKSDGTWATVSGGGGSSVTVFYTTSLFGSTTLYTDQARTTAATAQQIVDAVDAGGAQIYYDTATPANYTIIYYGLSSPDGVTFNIYEPFGGPTSYRIIYDQLSDTTATAYDDVLQKQVAAGTNITIGADGKTISAPSAVSAFSNDAGYLTSSALSSYYTKSETYSQNEVNSLINAITVPTKTSELNNDGDDGVHPFLATDDVATVATSGDYDDLINKPVIPSYSVFTGATSSTDGTSGLVPAPLIADKDKYLKGDGSWTTIVPELVEMSYGESNAWAKFIAAYNNKCIVYCRASSNANPGTGAKTRKAFMAYVNNETTPTQVEFQYYRSVSSHSDSQQGDQVFVYLLKNDNTWSVTTRNAFTKIAAGTNMTSSYSSGTLTLNGATIDSALDVSSTNPVQNSVVTAALNNKAANSDMTGATSSVAGVHGLVPAPAAGDQDKYLKGDGTWSSALAPSVISSADWSALWQ